MLFGKNTDLKLTSLLRINLLMTSGVPWRKSWIKHRSNTVRQVRNSLGKVDLNLATILQWSVFKTMNFKQAAEKILREAGKPLHYREITELALKKGIVETDGKTPWASMNALIATDIKDNGKNSPFIRTEPGFYYIGNLKINLSDQIKVSAQKPKVIRYRHTVTEHLSTKQKGDIAEARVAELITLYGDEGLSCYRPTSDGEGIDIIVKRRGKLDVVYVQVKSTYGYGERGFVSTVKRRNLVNKTRLLLVFVYFALSEGDLFDQLFCIPAPEFLKLTANEKKKTDDRTFTVGLSHPEKSKYAEFMIEKRELANKILEIMDRL